jgi:hypothetical protein
VRPEDILKEALDYWGGDCECEGGVVCRSCSADKALMELVKERDNWKRDYQEACKCVAEMHGAAVGGWGNAPKRGIVEDIEDVVKERDAMKTAYDTMFRVAEKAAAENKALRAGAPLGPIVGTETILNQELELKKLRAELDALKAEWDQLHDRQRLAERVREACAKDIENGFTSSYQRSVAETAGIVARAIRALDLATLLGEK